MRTFEDNSVLDECLNRLGRLEPSTRSRWGRMTAHQMVCHLSDSFGVATGTKYASPATGPFQRTILKWIALRTPFSWPHGVATRPEIEQGTGGTPPSDWAHDCEKLRNALLTFSARSTFGKHPMFGDVLPRIAGRSTVAGCTRHRLPRDLMNSPCNFELVRPRAPL